jgi:hypothetical protein
MESAISHLDQQIHWLEDYLKENWDNWNLDQKAAAYVRIQDFQKRIAADSAPLKKHINRLRDQVGSQWLVEAMDESGLTTINTKAGYRVTQSQRLFASVKGDQKDDAYDWLRNNGLDSLITQTVNAQTLSSAFKSMIEDENKEPPEDYFNYAYKPILQVTKAK